MNAKWYLFEIAVNFFQGWLFSFFLGKQLTPSHRRSRNAARLCRLGMILGVAFFYSLYLFIDLPVPDTVVLGCTFVFSLFLYSDPWYVQLLWNVVMGVVAVGITSLISQLFIHVAGVSWDALMEPSPLRVGFVLCGNVILFAAFYTIAQLRTPKGKLAWYAMALFVLLNGVILLAVEMQYNLSWCPGVKQEPVLITIFCLIFVGAGLLVMFELLSLKAEKQSKLELEIETTRMMEAHFEEVRSMYQRMLEYEHDMKHQINALRQMIEQGDMADGRDHLQELRRIALPAHYATGCIAVDALLSSKSAYMHHQQIDFHFTPYPLKEMPADAPVLCAIIGNLLDNAMEAIQRIAPIMILKRTTEGQVIQGGVNRRHRRRSARR